MLKISILFQNIIALDPSLSEFLSLFAINTNQKLEHDIKLARTGPTKYQMVELLSQVLIAAI